MVKIALCVSVPPQIVSQPQFYERNCSTQQENYDRSLMENYLHLLETKVL